MEFTLPVPNSFLETFWLKDRPLYLSLQYPHFVSHTVTLQPTYPYTV